jgi:hypothetical protein
VVEPSPCSRVVVTTDGASLTSQVLAELTRMLGGSGEGNDRRATELIATAVRVSPPTMTTWRGDPRLVPLDYRLVLALWLEGYGRSRAIDRFRGMGYALRVATQRERAAHIVEASVLFADAPNDERTDRVMAHAEARCRRSPPPDAPFVDGRAVDILLAQLLERDEGHFVIDQPTESDVRLATSG